MFTSLPCTGFLVQLLFPFLSSDCLLISWFSFSLSFFHANSQNHYHGTHFTHPSWASCPALDSEPFLVTIPVRALRTDLCVLPPTDPLCLINWDTPAAGYSAYRCPCSLLKKPELCLSGTEGEQQCFYRAVSVQTKPSKYIPTRSNRILEVQHVDFHFIVFCHGKFTCIFLGCVDGISLAWSPWSCQMSCSCCTFGTIEPPLKLKGTNFPSVSLQDLKQ